jgi:predicted PurR-regulated permease PerM
MFKNNIMSILSIIYFTFRHDGVIKYLQKCTKREAKTANVDRIYTIVGMVYRNTSLNCITVIIIIIIIIIIIHLHYAICMKSGIEITENWYSHIPKSVTEHEEITVL